MKKTLTGAIAKTLSAFVIGLLALPTFVWLANAGSTVSARSEKRAVTRQYQDFAQLPVTVQAEGRGTSRIKFKDGRDVPVNFNGESNLAQAAPLALAAGDFNSDGYEDIIGGFSSAGGGVVTLYRTNSDAIAPSTAAIHQEMMNGRFPAPILPEAVSVMIPENPDFIGTGDFNRDGYKDVLTAARGSFALHLLAGDGRGNFKYERRVELPGTVTTLLADDVNNYDGMTDAIVGIGGGFAPKALVFHNSDAMFDQQPAEINLPADAISMTVGQLDTDALKDLVVAVGNELLVVRGYNNLASENLKMKIERVALPSTARSVTTGEFLFDREMRPEIAVLLDDGSVAFAARGNIDRRPYSIEEQRIIAEKRRARDKGGLTAFTKASLQKQVADAWKIEENAVASKGSVGASARLVTAPLAGLSTDDLMVVDAENNQMRIVQSSQGGTDSQSSVIDLEMPSGAIAAVSLRLNIDTAPDIALLRQGSSSPTVLLSPEATITVNSTADAIANNGQCTLREAIINSNNDDQSGSTDCTAGSGADTIMLPAGTITLAIGPFDNEEGLDGYVPTSGDLDIADGDGGTTGDVGDVTLMGVAGSTIIQAGTTTTNGVDRVFDVNNFVSLGTAVNATFTNLTIRHGRGYIAPFGYFTPGGGIMFDAFNVPTGGRSNKTLTLNGSIITLNNSAGQGGGILAINGAANLVNSTVSSNSITETGSIANWNNGAGGGMSYDGGGDTTPARTFSMSGTTFSNNVISSSDAGQGNFGQGGGARLAGGTGASITGSSQILANDAKSLGGGFSIDTIPAVTIGDTLVNGNVADTDGGGIFSKPVNSNGSLSSLTLTNVQFISNQADDDDDNTGDGGGLYHDRGTLNISGGAIGTPVGGNTAFNGGGLAHDFESLPTAGVINGSSVTINGTGIENNSARGSGGGIYHDSLNVTGGQNSTLTLGNTTNVNLLNNLANLNGGGLSNTNAGIANLTRATIRVNRADNDNNNTGDGGGVFNNGAVTITGATTPIGGAGAGEGNTARNGGGIANLGGTLTMTGGSIIANGSAANPATLNGGGVYVNGGTTTLDGVTITNNIAAAGNGFNLNAGTLNLAGILNVTNNIALAGGIFNGQASTVNLTGNFAYTAGTFTAGTSTFNFNGTGPQSISNSSLITFFNLTDSNVSQFLAVNNSFNVNGTLNINGANAVLAPFSTAIIGGTGTLTGTGTARVTRITGANDFFTQYAMPNRTLTTLTVDYVGAAAQGVSGTTYSNVRLNNASGGTLSGSATVNGTLFLTVGTLNVGTNVLTINNGITVGTGGLTSAPTGTVIYNQGSNGQTVVAANYGNLTFSNFNKTLPAGTIGVAGTFTPGTATGHTITGSTFNFNGAGAQTVPVFSYDNLTISGARGGATVTLGSGTINVAGVFSPTATVVNYVVTGNTFVFNGAAQTIPAFTFNNMTTAGSGTKTLGGNVTTQGALTIGGGTTLNGGSFNLNANGGWANNGAFAPATGTVAFNGTSAQTVGGANATDFNNLTINNAAGVTFNFNSTVGGNLTLTSGNVLMGANTLTLNGLASRTSGHVIGNLRKTLNSGNNFTYTVGTANGYSPLNVVVNSGTGDLTVSATQTFLSPPLNSANGLRRYWSLTATGSLNTNLTFNYLDIDLAPGTAGTEGNYRLIRVSGGNGTAIVGARPNTAANTITANNVTQFSDWTMVWINPTAATAMVEGRVTTSTGKGVSGARLAIESPNGEVRYATTNPFGYYRFADVAVGSSYVVTVSHKRYTFGKSARLVTVMGDVQGVDFVSEQ